MFHSFLSEPNPHTMTMEKKLVVVDDDVVVFDRISELPEHVLQHILSFLPTKQVVQCTVLSTKWKHVWTTFPILRFDENYFDLKAEFAAGYYLKHKKSVMIEKKTKFVEKTLQSHRRRRLCINSFTLSDCWLEEESLCCVDRWIGLVLESDVQQLNLDFGWANYYRYYAGYYCLPHSVFVAKSLTVLTLHRLSLSALKLESTYLPSLRELSLDFIKADNQMIQNLVSGCPVIEYLTFKECYGFGSIELPSVPKLIALTFKACYEFESIKLSNAPKLVAFTVEHNINLERIDMEASNLCSLCIHQTLTLRSKLNLLPFKHLKMLSIWATNITYKWLHDHLLGLPLLEDLQLFGCVKWERIIISNHHLKSLGLHQCRHLVELKIDAPKLCKFSYLGAYIKFFSSNALALSQALYDLTTNAPSSFEKIEFLPNLSNPKLLKMRISSAKDVIIPKELRRFLPSPSYNVKHLKVTILLPFTRQEIDELVDCLLWISPLLDSLSIKWSHKSRPDFDQISLKFSYRKTIYEGNKYNSSCCGSLPFPCWRHCLKTVKINTLKGFVDGEIIFNYFFKNARTLEGFQFRVGEFD